MTDADIRHETFILASHRANEATPLEEILADAQKIYDFIKSGVVPAMTGPRSEDRIAPRANKKKSRYSVTKLLR